MTTVNLISDCLHLKFNFGKNSARPTCHVCSSNMLAKVACLGQCGEARAQGKNLCLVYKVCLYRLLWLTFAIYKVGETFAFSWVNIEILFYFYIWGKV